MAKKRTQLFGYTKNLQRLAERASILSRQGRLEEAQQLRQIHDDAYKGRVNFLSTRNK